MRIQNLKAYSTGLITGHDIKDFAFKNSTVISSGNEISLTDARNVSLRNVNFEIKGNKEIEVELAGELTDSVLFGGCNPELENFVKKQSNF